MLRKKKSLILAGLFLILLAGGLFIPQQDAAAQKIRIAVMPFKLGQIQRWWGWDWDPGEGISDMLVTELVNSGRFSVVERERLDEVLQEQNLAREGVINAATAARIGRILGVQLFVFGTVTQFSLDSKVIELPVAGKVAEWRARCTLNARLVNVETSEIMAAVTGQGAESQSNVALSERWGDLSGFTFGSSRFAEHILGKATTKAVEDVAEKIGQKAAGLTPVAVTPTVTPQVTVTPTVAQAKIRIAVMPFKLGQIQRWWGWDWDPGEGISDMLVTELVNSGRFSVVERERLNEVLQEQNLTREGVVDAATAARIGKVLGVQLFVFGTVTQFSLDSKIIKLPVLGELAEWRARCTLNARLVNVETSEIMAAVTGQGAKSQSNVRLSEKWGDLSGFTFGSSRFEEHILGKATTKAVEDVAEGIEEKTVGLTPVVVIPEVTPTVTPEVEPEVIEGLVAKVSDDEVVINVGSQKGVKVDDIFSVRRITETITDPETGEVILETKDKIAEIKISQVHERAAIGKITLLGVGKEIEVGDLVDLQK